MDDLKIKQNSDNSKNFKKKKHSILIFISVLLKAILILIILAIFLGIIGVLFNHFYSKNLDKQISEIDALNSKAIKNVTETVEYGSSITYNDIITKLVSENELVKGSKVQIYVNDKLLDNTEEYVFKNVGSNNIKVKIVCDKLIEHSNTTVNTEKQITWNVVDTKKPILTGVHDSEIKIGDKFDVKSGITAKDEVDGDLEVTVEGDLNLKKAGTYTLTAKATDKNNNETTQTFKVTVKEEEKKVASSSTSTNSSSSNKTSSSSSNNNSSSSSNKNSSSSSTTSGSSSNKNSSSQSSGSTSNKNSGSSSSGSSSSSNSASTKAGRLALAKAEAKRVVAKIITAGMTNYQKAEAICMYITNNVASQNNQSTEAYKTNYGNEAYAALVMKIAACSGRCKAVTLLCDAAGLKSQHINKDLWTHQWNRIQMEDGSWLTIDSQIGLVTEGKHFLEE